VCGDDEDARKKEEQEGRIGGSGGGRRRELYVGGWWLEEEVERGIQTYIYIALCVYVCLFKHITKKTRGGRKAPPSESHPTHTKISSHEWSSSLLPLTHIPLGHREK
jgi:hypothetical protein